MEIKEDHTKALAALSSAFSPQSTSKSSAPRLARVAGSEKAAAVAAVSSVLTAKRKIQSPDGSPSTSPLAISPPPETKSDVDPSEAEESQEFAEAKGTSVASETDDDDSEPKQQVEQDEIIIDRSQSTFSYDQLKAKSENPVMGIDFKRRETYLSDEEFETIFGMSKEEFYKLPKWKQDMQKKKVDLF